MSEGGGVLKIKSMLHSQKRLKALTAVPPLNGAEGDGRGAKFKRVGTNPQRNPH